MIRTTPSYMTEIISTANNATYHLRSQSHKDLSFSTKPKIHQLHDFQWFNDTKLFIRRIALSMCTLSPGDWVLLNFKTCFSCKLYVYLNTKTKSINVLMVCMSTSCGNITAMHLVLIKCLKIKQTVKLSCTICNWKR